jgi:hypothetical protein
MNPASAPIQTIRTPQDIICRLSVWPVGQQARLYGVSERELAGFYLPHVLVAHALQLQMPATISDVREVLLYGDAHRANTMALFAAPPCTAVVLPYLLATGNLHRIRLVTPSPSIVPDLDPSIRRLFPTLTAEGVEVHALRYAGRADPPDVLVLLPTTDPLDFDLEREDHALWRHLAGEVIIIGISNTRAEALLIAAYFALFGATVTAPKALPLCDAPDRSGRCLGYVWQVVSRDAVLPSADALERFGALVDMLREDDAFDDDLFGAGTLDPTAPYAQLVHGHWLHLERGTIHYVASVDDLLDAHEPPPHQPIAAQVPTELLDRRPSATAPLLDRWHWVLDVFEQAKPIDFTPSNTSISARSLPS